MQTFENIDYKGGHPRFTKPCTVAVKVDAVQKTVKLIGSAWSGAGDVIITADEIVNISFEEKGKRSVGKAAAGAIIGGVLTGGIGLLVGGALGARKKDTSNLFITIKHNERELDVILKAGKKADDIYGAIAAIL